MGYFAGLKSSTCKFAIRAVPKIFKKRPHTPSKPTPGATHTRAASGGGQLVGDETLV
jgi:hypothetical protein